MGPLRLQMQQKKWRLTTHEGEALGKWEVLIGRSLQRLRSPEARLGSCISNQGDFQDSHDVFGIKP